MTTQIYADPAHSRADHDLVSGRKDVGLPGYMRLKPLSSANLEGLDLKFLERLDAFEAPWLEEKLLAEGKFANQTEYRVAFLEFKKYVTIIAIYHEKLAMMSETVDEVWHQFILFTYQYHDFCNDFLGYYLHHVPKTSHTPLDKQHKRTLTRYYKALFGQPPAIWDIKSVCSSCNNGCSSSGMCSGGDD